MILFTQEAYDILLNTMKIPFWMLYRAVLSDNFTQCDIAYAKSQSIMVIFKIISSV